MSRNRGGLILSDWESGDYRSVKWELNLEQNGMSFDKLDEQMRGAARDGGGPARDITAVTLVDRVPTAANCDKLHEFFISPASATRNTTQIRHLDLCILPLDRVKVNELADVPHLMESLSFTSKETSQQPDAIDLHTKQTEMLTILANGMPHLQSLHIRVDEPWTVLTEDTLNTLCHSMSDLHTLTLPIPNQIDNPPADYINLITQPPNPPPYLQLNHLISHVTHHSQKPSPIYLNAILANCVSPECQIEFVNLSKKHRHDSRGDVLGWLAKECGIARKMMVGLTYRMLQMSETTVGGWRMLDADVDADAVEDAAGAEAGGL